MKKEPLPKNAEQVHYHYHGTAQEMKEVSFQDKRDKKCIFPFNFAFLPAKKTNSHEKKFHIVRFASCKYICMPQEEKEPVVFDFQDPSPPPMKAVSQTFSCCSNGHDHGPWSPVMVSQPKTKTDSYQQCEITYLSSVGSISWKYLTPKRPHDAKTEPFFSRSANSKIELAFKPTRMIELDGRSLMNRKKEAALLDMVGQAFEDYLGNEHNIHNNYYTCLGAKVKIIPPMSIRGEKAPMLRFRGWGREG